MSHHSIVRGAPEPLHSFLKESKENENEPVAERLPIVIEYYANGEEMEGPKVYQGGGLLQCLLNGKTFLDTVLFTILVFAKFALSTHPNLFFKWVFRYHGFESKVYKK